MKNTIIVGDVRQTLPSLQSGSVQCCVTSPPYFGLRDYGHDGQIGLEQTPEEYVAQMVEVFREVRRVMRDDGTLWLNLGDSYANNGVRDSSKVGGFTGERIRRGVKGTMDSRPREIPEGLKPKDLVGIPWRVAFALQADGWWLRQDIIWHKPNPMPESVTDRCTKAHEYVFLLAKSERYYYDAEAVSETTAKIGGNPRHFGSVKQVGTMRQDIGQTFVDNGKRNRRSVWTVSTKPYAGAHFATMPPELAETCILAGSKPGDLVLDPFGGSGTTAMVAAAHGRDWLLCELNPTYAEECAWPRIRQGWNPETKQARKASAVGQRTLFE